jgi:predicted permease
MPCRDEVRAALAHARTHRTLFVTAALILAAGLGMAIAMSVIVTEVLLRPLPIVGSESVESLAMVGRGAAVEIPVNRADLATLQRASHRLSDIAGIAHYGSQVFPAFYHDASIVLAQARVTGNFFSLLGTQPAIGRLLLPSDDAVDAPLVTVLTYETWQRDFGGSRSILGQRVTVEDGTRGQYQIVGVAPPGLDLPRAVNYWVPIAPTHYDKLALIGRAAPGATQESVNAEAYSILTRLDGSHAQPAMPLRIDSTPVRDTILGDLRPTLLLLSAAVAMLLLISCLNVGNLLLLHGAARKREIAVRRAIGASTWHLIRQLLIESSIIAIAGGFVGLLIAVGLLQAILALVPAELPQFADIQVVTAPVAGMIAISMLTIPLFALYPALVTAKVSPGLVLRSESRSSTEAVGRRRNRYMLVSTQVALAFIALVAAGLLDRTYARLKSQILGYEPSHLAILDLAVAPYVRKLTADPSANATQYLDHLDDVYAGIREIPGVVALSPIIVDPFRGSSFWSFRPQIDGQSSAEMSGNPSVAVDLVGPEYIETLGTRLLRGRQFAATDRENTPNVALVSDAAARELWPGLNPLGKRFRLDSDTGTASWRTVVGVVADTHLREFRAETPAVLFPYRQWTSNGLLAIRTTGPLAPIVPSIRRAVRAVDPDIHLWRARSMDELLAQPMAGPRLASVLLSAFGFTAFLLSGIGLYSAVSWSMRAQRRDTAIRIALGASPRALRNNVLRTAGYVVGTGIVAGLLFTAFAARAISSLLFGVAPNDPATLVGASALLMAIGLVAAWRPAQSALEIDNVQLLRGD